jgi:uncharacterized membrane protein
MTVRIIASALLIASLLPFTASAQTDEQSSFEARVERMEPKLCEDGSEGCFHVVMTGTSGPFDGQTISTDTAPQEDLGGKRLPFEEGDSVIVQTQEFNGERTFFISDVVRRTPLMWLGVLFVIAVFLFGGISALRSFLGLIISFGMLIFFIIPRILAGDPPLLIAIIGSLVIMIVTFLICHGWNRKTIAAFGGTAASLVLTGLLASAFAAYAKLTGTADEEMLFLMAEYPTLNTTGILLAGIIIGTLGVLDDITISQASAVFELRGANPLWGWRELFRSAYRIGADHIAAAVNTLVLAYAGTTLPLLLLLIGVSAGESWWTFLNREMIATEIVRTLVGSIGLLAAVPLTTFIASVLAVRTNSAKLPTHNHAH